MFYVGQICSLNSPLSLGLTRELAYISLWTSRAMSRSQASVQGQDHMPRDHGPFLMTA